jgi:NADH:ubiquinone oxidoreductase subunit 3 (subunit A)
MNGILLSPPFALVVYLALVGVLAGFGRVLAGAARRTSLKSTTYASGEEAPPDLAIPGYRGFFVIGLFFAVLHLGALMLATSDLSPVAAVYLVGLLFALVALILG